MNHDAARPTPRFTYVDLFAGIGGFHAALSGLGGECVYAVEIDEAASRIYHQNWGRDPHGDITRDANDEIMRVPPHDVLAAGFPCQPFSKSGAQRGMDETRGTLYWNILKIIEAHHPRLVLLENVRNIAGPRHLHEWQVIIETLRAQGYRVSETAAVLSPHQLPHELGGRPQVRERVFIAATYNPEGLDSGLEPEVVTAAIARRADDWELATDLPLDPDTHVSGCDLSGDEVSWLDAWNAWVEMMWEIRAHQADADGSVARGLPGFPVWVNSWRRFTAAELAAEPAWKRNFMVKNSELYLANKKAFDRWLRAYHVASFPASRQKFEWQAQGTPSLWDCVIQMRPSGIRAKRPTHLPALVAITQTSIVGSRRRRLSPREAARLQGFPEAFSFDGQTDALTYRQLGNGVNVGAVWNVLKAQVARDEDILKRPDPVTGSTVGLAIFNAISNAPAGPDAPVAAALAAGQLAYRDGLAARPNPAG